MTDKTKSPQSETDPKQTAPDPNLSPDGVPYEDEKDENGRRYVIPNLRPSDENYLERYGNRMYLKFHNPSLFRKIMNWD
jgi:hypothetical protein